MRKHSRRDRSSSQVGSVVQKIAISLLVLVAFYVAANASFILIPQNIAEAKIIFENTQPFRQFSLTSSPNQNLYSGETIADEKQIFSFAIEEILNWAPRDSILCGDHLTQANVKLSTLRSLPEGMDIERNTALRKALGVEKNQNVIEEFGPYILDCSNLSLDKECSSVEEMHSGFECFVIEQFNLMHAVGKFWIVSFHPIIFSSNGRRATLNYSQNCGWLCGLHREMKFIKISNRWLRVSYKTPSVS